MQLIYFVPLVIVVVIVAAIFGFREMSRWKSVVALSAPVPLPQRFIVCNMNNAIVDGFQFNGTMKIGIGDGGLLLQPIFPLSIAMPAVFIPLKLLNPLNTMKYGLHLFSVAGTDTTIGISEKWSSKVKVVKGVLS